jgi:putative transposase
MLCRVLEVSSSGYYDWLRRDLSRRAKENEQLLVEIRRIHYEYRQAYGSLKVRQELERRGLKCGKHRVARLRREAGIETRRKRRFKITTRSKKSQLVVPNILNRCFKIEEPNKVWVGDVTFIATRRGWLYLAVLLDLYSRKIIGWSTSTQIDKQLALSTLNMAMRKRRASSGVLHHTDQGSVYSCDEYMTKLRSNNMMPSMSRKGDCYDNAVAESFFSTLKNELIVGKLFATREEAHREVSNYIEVFYNRRRIHQALGYRTPEEMDKTVPILNRP